MSAGIRFNGARQREALRMGGEILKELKEAQRP